MSDQIAWRKEQVHIMQSDSDLDSLLHSHRLQMLLMHVKSILKCALTQQARSTLAN